MSNQKPRILAIDDTPANLATLGAALSAEFDLQTAISGSMGLALAKECPPDLILLDVMMPGMDGYETCRRLKAEPALKNIPVIFVTAQSDIAAEEHGLSLGAADYVTKPINVAICRQRIRNLLQREQLHKELEKQSDLLSEQLRQSKQAEKKLQLAASVFNTAFEGIMITEADGTIINVNEAFTRITGYSPEEVIGRKPRFLGSGRQSRESFAAMWGTLQEKGHWRGEIWNRRKNGEVYAQMQSISSVPDLDGCSVRYVSLFSDITSVKDYQQQLEQLAHFDVLTGLPNRVLLADRLRCAMALVQRQKKLLAVIFIDLDGFKAVNDQHGHQAGDQLLIDIAARLKDGLRESDTLARIGGDEFVAVLLDLSSIEDCIPMLGRLLTAAAQPVSFGGSTLQVSASLGVTFYPQADEIDAVQLQSQADHAMYHAKFLGKNCYHLFDAEQKD